MSAHTLPIFEPQTAPSRLSRRTESVLPPAERNGTGVPRHGFLLDMDGVLYRGDEPIPGALEFIRSLHERNIPFLFLTNNSASTPLDYVVKLDKLGIEAGEEHFYTCAMATVDFLQLQKPGGTAYVIGEGGLISALYQAG